MAFLAWSDNFSVGVMELDAQHKQLVGYLNQLYAAMSLGQGAGVIKPILDGLVQYTITHFSTEERYMLQYQYPGFKDQKKEHEELTRKVCELKDRFSNGQKMLSIETLNFLKHWLTTHIQGSDKRYSSFFAENGVR